MPDEPLIFVEVALTAEVPGSIDDLLTEDRVPLAAEEAKVATFYSISNCQQGLAGVSFGNLLIKQVAAELKLEHPGLETFVTLSPLPGLNRWLQGLHAASEVGKAIEDILTGTAEPQDLRIMAARYLLHAKRADGLPLDPVARFHLGNGAEVFDLHAQADTSEKGMGQSSGAMVNYLYDLRHTERNHEDFALHASVAASRRIQILAKAEQSNKPMENSA